jgi:putative transposase
MSKAPEVIKKRKSKLNSSILNSCWGFFDRVLTYKAKLFGRKVDYVNAHYSSQDCNLCDYRSKENRKTQSVFHCQKCNHKDNADINAAKNLIKRYIRRNCGAEVCGAEGKLNFSCETENPSL